jgi:enoyl-CoA hydratase
MTVSTVRIDIEGFIGRITLDRPQFMNALNAQVLSDLIDACAQIAASDVRCVVVTGAGDRAFAAGADIAAMQTMSRAEGTAMSALGNRAFRAVETLPMPTVAAVNGFALGGGCELALACDIRYAAESASFGQPEVGIGIPPGFGGSQRLARVIGSGPAKEMIFTGARIDAAEALRLGLVNRVVPAAELAEQVTALADRIAKNSPLGVRAAKKAVDLGSGVDIETGMGIEAMLFGSCFEHEDQRQAMAAFVEKKKPAPFTGR